MRSRATCRGASSGPPQRGTRHDRAGRPRRGCRGDHVARGFRGCRQAERNVMVERQRQADAELSAARHDDVPGERSLLLAADCYTATGGAPRARLLSLAAVFQRHGRGTATLGSRRFRVDLVRAGAPHPAKRELRVRAGWRPQAGSGRGLRCCVASTERVDRDGMIPPGRTSVRTSVLPPWGAPRRPYRSAPEILRIDYRRSDDRPGLRRGGPPYDQKCLRDDGIEPWTWPPAAPTRRRDRETEGCRTGCIIVISPPGG